jgi:hypothetical protein
MNLQRVVITGVAFLGFALAAQYLARTLMQQDSALPGEKDFVTTSPQVVAAVGPVRGLDVVRVLKTQGSPGREPAYHQFDFRAAGDRATATVTVRAEEVSTESYRYRLVEVRK